MLLDILDNLPRLRMSSNQLKMILWILNECKVVSVPSYSGFRRMQDRLRGLCGSEPKGYTSSIGNRFFVNDVRESIARVSLSLLSLFTLGLMCSTGFRKSGSR